MATAASTLATGAVSLGAGAAALFQKAQSFFSGAPRVQAAASRLPVAVEVQKAVVNPVPATREFARILTPAQVQALERGLEVPLSAHPGAQSAFVTASESLPSGLSPNALARLAGIKEANVGGIVRVFHSRRHGDRYANTKRRAWLHRTRPDHWRPT